MEIKNLKISQVARELGVSKVTILRYIRLGKLRAFRINKLWFVPETEVYNLIRKSNGGN